MGKNWKGQKYEKSNNNDLTSCRGLGIILGTCDAARERETSKELVNLFNQAIEEIEGEKEAQNHSNSNGTSSSSSSYSVQAMLFDELNEIRNSKSATTQNVMSINTGVKGIVVIKVLNTKYCPLQLVQHVFDNVKQNKVPSTRYVVRVVPLQQVFYPNAVDLQLNIISICNQRYGSQHVITKSSDSSSSSSVIAVSDETTTNIITPPDETNILEHSELSSSLTKTTTNDDDKSNSNNCLKRKQSFDATTAPSDMIKPACKLQAVDNTVSAVTDSVSNNNNTGCYSKEVEDVLAAVRLKLAFQSATRQNNKNLTQQPSSSSFSSSSSSYVYNPNQYTYNVLFKARSHNVLTRQSVLDCVACYIPANSKLNFSKFKDVFVVEALKNICGASLVTGDMFNEYLEFNLRKYQAKYTTTATSGDYGDSNIVRPTATIAATTTAVTDDCNQSSYNSANGSNNNGNSNHHDCEEAMVSTVKGVEALVPADDDDDEEEEEEEEEEVIHFFQDGDGV